MSHRAKGIDPPLRRASIVGECFFWSWAGAGPEPGRRAGVTAGRKRELRPGRSRGRAGAGRAKRSERQAGPEPGRSRAGAGLESERGGSRAGAGQSQSRAEPEPGQSGAGPEPGRQSQSGAEAGAGVSELGRSWAGVGPEPGQSQSGAEARPGRSRARAERSERQPGRSRASVRWRTAGATCSATWPPIRSEVQSRPERELEPEPGSLARVVQSGTGRSRLELQPGLCGARAGDVEPASQSPGAGETSIVVHTVYVPSPKL